MLRHHPRGLLSNRNLARFYSAVPESNSGLEVSITVENQHGVLSNAVTPLAELNYVDQLKRKKNWTLEVLKAIKSKPLPKTKTHLHTIVPSPIVDHYRNKDEFGVRTGVDGDSKTVGLFVGRPSEGRVVCVEPTHLRNIKPRHKEVAKAFQTMIRESPLRACHDLNDGGYWKSIIVRTTRKGETMAIVKAHPSGSTAQELDNSKAQLKEHFQDLRLESLQFQLSPHARAIHEQSPYELLSGEPHIFERISEYNFRISPDAFFQVNVEAAPLLYDRAIDFSGPSLKCSLLDLCCGTGTVSLLASKQYRGCVGIEAVGQAVNDASFNASLNFVHNCHFTKGLIEKSLKRVLSELDMSPELSAILNPGRAGCNKPAIRALRDCRQIRNLVYVSCKADHPNVMDNFYLLCQPLTNCDFPFYLTSVQPVDLFPHTEHCELILQFQR